MHSFHAFIDEAGDEGFKFRPWPEQGSSEWFVISACVIRATRMPAAARELHKTLDPIEAARTAPAHFRNLPHEAKVALIAGIAALPVRAVNICFNKPLVEKSTLISKRRLHFYSARLLLERISWIARDHHKRGEGDGRCKLTFSRCKNLSYASLQEYFARLAGQHTNIAWEHLDAASLEVLGHERSIWLRAADALASGVCQGLELSRYGFSEDRYARLMHRIVYQNGSNYRSYGMKFMPRRPAVEAERDNRYDWLSLYK